MKWTWSLLLAVVLTIIVVEVTGFFLPSRTDVARSAEIDAPREEVFALLEDFSTWPEWASLLALADGGTVEPQLMGEERGLGAQMLARYPGANQVLFTIVEFEAPSAISINTRSGLAEDDLLAGDGFEGWDDLTLETLGSDSCRVTWRRRSADIDSYWLRFVDRFVFRGPMEDSLQKGVDALKDFVEARD